MIDADRDQKQIARTAFIHRIAALGGALPAFDYVQFMIEMIVCLGIALFAMQKKAGIEHGLHTIIAKHRRFHADQFFCLPILKPNHVIPPNRSPKTKM
jgi:hypothetical protein